MKKSNLVVGAAFAALVGGMAIATSPAYAAPKPTPGIGCTVTQEGPPSRPPSQAWFRVIGKGFPPGASVMLTDSAGTVLGRSTARQPDGYIEFPYLPNGNYTVVSKSARVNCVKVLPPGQQQQPPSTG
ncbi:hypothetical protein [Streptomyces sp. NPDC001312]|uniref:hypothetical protein n=1 Tax=Streptomyces sp. NPDC001312 TaxID=3364561 RepID=UPI0036740AE1